MIKTILTKTELVRFNSDELNVVCLLPENGNYMPAIYIKLNSTGRTIRFTDSFLAKAAYQKIEKFVCNDDPLLDLRID